MLLHNILFHRNYVILKYLLILTMKQFKSQNIKLLTTYFSVVFKKQGILLKNYYFYHKFGTFQGNMWS